MNCRRNSCHLSPQKCVGTSVGKATQDKYLWKTIKVKYAIAILIKKL